MCLALYQSELALDSECKVIKRKNLNFAAGVKETQKSNDSVLAQRKEESAHAQACCLAVPTHDSEATYNLR